MTTRQSNSICPDWAETELGMSNFDGFIDDGLEQQLRTEEVYGRHAGWNFNALVWFDRETQEFVSEVWRYHEPVSVKRAKTLPDLRNEVNDEYGWE